MQLKIIKDFAYDISQRKLEKNYKYKNKWLQKIVED